MTSEYAPTTPGPARQHPGALPPIGVADGHPVAPGDS